jgi:methylmalonyl-CoA carboxyltransferase large subunit
MSQPTVAELLDAVNTLAARVESLESELAALRAEIPPKEIPEEVVIAISAAVAAFLGHRARLKQVHYRTSQSWAQQGRAAVQRRNVLHGVR